MKINNKGFMLAEVVVVSVVVATVLVTLFTGVNNVSSAYETRNRYYDVDSLYIAMEVNDILVRENYNFSSLSAAGSLDSFVSSFTTFYNEKIHNDVKVYISPYEKNKMNGLTGINNNATFYDYLDYLSGNFDFEDENYNYMIIVERCEDNDDCYYYALRLKY